MGVALPQRSAPQAGEFGFLAPDLVGAAEAGSRLGGRFADIRAFSEVIEKQHAPVVVDPLAFALFQTRADDDALAAGFGHDGLSCRENQTGGTPLGSDAWANHKFAMMPLPNRRASRCQKNNQYGSQK
jgi:hypothetical protein